MKPYETKAAKIGMQAPRHLNGKTAEEIVDYLCSHFKTDFDDDFKQIPLNKSTAYLIAVSEAIFNPDDWRGPIKAWFPSCGEEWAKAVVIWYHGCQPRSNGYWVYSPGYACW